MTLADVEAEVAGLRDIDLAALRARWRVVAGRPVSKSLSRHVLVRLLAYQLQARLLGDLSRKSVRFLDRIGGEAVAPPPPTASARAGTVLVREWNGVRHHVMAVAGGYAWNGGTFRSLSEVARAITGTKWSGPRFFGLPSSTGRGRA